MDTWVIQQLSFWFTVYEVKPALMVDKLVDFLVDLSIPGRGHSNARSWWESGLRTLEQSGERTSRELDYRSMLRTWDRDHPQIHHELIVRYLCGAVVSVVVSSVYTGLVHGGGRRRSASRR